MVVLEPGIRTRKSVKSCEKLYCTVGGRPMELDGVLVALIAGPLSINMQQQGAGYGPTNGGKPMAAHMGLFEVKGQVYGFTGSSPAVDFGSKV